MITRISLAFLIILFPCTLCAENSTEKVKSVLKCCERDEILKKNGSIYLCDNDKYTVPLNLKGNYVVSFPYNCTNEYCLDKSASGEIIELFCPEKVKSVNNVSVNVHYKCCPEGMSYDLSGKYCRYSDYSYDMPSFYRNQKGLVDVQVGMPECKKAIVDILTQDNISLVDEQFRVKDLLTNNEFTLKKGHFCVDSSVEGTNVLRSCETVDICKKRYCLTKCCASGEFFAPEGDIFGCQTKWDESKLLNPNFTTTKGFNYTAEKLVLIDTLHCLHGKYLFDKNLFYNFWPNGTLMQSEETFESTDAMYCIENVYDMFDTEILMCFGDPNKITESKFYFYFTGLVVSSVFLMLTLVVYFFLPDLQNLHGKTVMCHVSSLLAAFICLSLVQRKTYYEDKQCIALGYSIYFTFIGSFSWLNVMCFDIWWTFGMVRMRDIRKNKEIKRFLLYCLYAFGLSFVLTVITMAADFTDVLPLDFKPKIGGERCWFDLEMPYARAIFFITPIAIQIVANCILFTLTAINCVKVKKEISRISDSNTSKKKTFLVNKETFMMNLKLSIIMGVAWVFEIVSTYVHEPIYLWYALDAINVLQGVWIFCIFVLKQKVWKALKHKFGYKKATADSSTSTQSTHMSGKNSVTSASISRFNSINKDTNAVDKDAILKSTK